MTSAKQILIKTLPYILAKLALGGISVAIGIVLLLLWSALGLHASGFGAFIVFLIWILVSGSATYFIMHYAGYKIKAGHIAVTAEAAGNNRIPANQINWGGKHVQQQYPNCAAYLSMKKRVSLAIREIQSTLGRSHSIYGRNTASLLIEPLILRFMRYMDGCCIGWIFLRRKQNMYKSAAEGVAIYANSHKVLLVNAVKIMVKSLIYAGAVLLIAFLFLGILCRAIGVSSLIALWLSVLCTWAVKFAVLDSYIMIRTLTNFTKAARHVTISADTCHEYCKMSDTYRRIWKKAQV